MTQNLDNDPANAIETLVSHTIRFGTAVGKDWPKHLSAMQTACPFIEVIGVCGTLVLKTRDSVCFHILPMLFAVGDNFPYGDKPARVIARYYHGPNPSSETVSELSRLVSAALLETPVEPCPNKPRRLSITQRDFITACRRSYFQVGFRSFISFP